MGRAKARYPDYCSTPSTLKISADDWRRIEKAYGRPLSSTLRTGIIEATEILKFKAIFAGDQRIADVENRIKRIKKGAEALLVAFRAGHSSPSHWFGDLCIESHLSADPANEHVSVSVSNLIKQIDLLTLPAQTHSITSTEPQKLLPRSVPFGTCGSGHSQVPFAKMVYLLAPARIPTSKRAIVLQPLSHLFVSCKNPYHKNTGQFFTTMRPLPRPSPAPAANRRTIINSEVVLVVV
jgi:hypothetical protein